MYWYNYEKTLQTAIEAVKTAQISQANKDSIFAFRNMLVVEGLTSIFITVGVS